MSCVFLISITRIFVVSIRGVPLPLGAWERLLYLIVALTGPFIKLYCSCIR